ncbi:DUF3822 family protein [Sediminibacter sp. Hel_I_10]|uniref:DUF3822 family protein n=1 Tax=Sediminibacter sp. Hel_I_10 TaxID=1392490 RepID=UPI00047C84DC|nr:DUF3822 family protein [Sediminibacter sp. Hel_I_10]
MKTQPVKDLSIQIHLNGLSFCILNKENATVEFLKHVPFEKKETPHELLHRLKTAIDTHSVFEQSFQNVICIFQNDLSCLVPKTLFDEAFLADYLKFNAKILKTDYITFDEISNVNAVNVYVPLVNINNYLFDLFGSFVFKHSSTVLLENLIYQAQSNQDTQFYVHVNAQSFELIIIKNKELQFYNTFQYHTKEDFIYYLLFTIEQLDLDVETLKLWFLGEIRREDDLFKLTYKYVRFVDLLDFKTEFKCDDTIEQSNLLQHYMLLNSFN